MDEARTAQRGKYPTPEQAKEAWTERPAADQARQPEPDKPQAEKWHNRDATKMEEKIFRVMDGAERGGASVAAGLYAEGITLARVDAKGKADMEADYRRQFENAKLQDIREGTHTARLRRATFNEGELVAVTRWGDVHRLNPRFLDLDKLERAATRTAGADEGSGRTPTLSDARAHFATVRQEQKDERARAWETEQQFWAEERAGERTDHAFRHALKETVRSAADAGLKVVDAKGMTTSLGSFIESLFGMRAKPEPANQNEAQQQRRAYAALEHIAESMERGDDLSASDVANLLPVQLENLKRHGDAYMREMISDLERDRQREQDYSRTRER